MGFFKNDNGTILRAVESVKSRDYELLAVNHENHTYPVDGWYWFDSPELARKFYESIGVYLEWPEEI